MPNSIVCLSVWLYLLVEVHECPCPWSLQGHDRRSIVSTVVYVAGSMIRIYDGKGVVLHCRLLTFWILYILLGKLKDLWKEPEDHNDKLFDTPALPGEISNSGFECVVWLCRTATERNITQVAPPLAMCDIVCDNKYIQYCSGYLFFFTNFFLTLKGVKWGGDSGNRSILYY